MRTLFLRVSKKINLEKHLNFFFSKKINGIKIIVPVLGEIGKGNLNNRERWMYELLKTLFEIKTGFLVDVGVNIGQTLIHYKTAFEKGQYIGFEPNPACIYYVQKLIEANKWSNCTLIPAGIFTQSDLTEINYYSATTDSMATVISNFRSDRKVVRKEWIPCYDSEVVEKLFIAKSIAVIKVDVEGAELEVLHALLTILKEERPFVIAELLPPQPGNENAALAKVRQIQGLFQSLNYYTVRIHKNSDSTLAKLEQMNDPAIGLTRSVADHLFCPAERWPIF